jgi:DtxR family Mn-dependent transcriptional regulator
VRISDSDPESCATSRRAASTPGDDLEVVEKQPFDGPVFARFGGEVHVLGGSLARAMKLSCEPAAARRRTRPSVAERAAARRSRRG